MSNRLFCNCCSEGCDEREYIFRPDFYEPTETTCMVSITTETETRVLVEQIHRADSDGEETVVATVSDNTSTSDSTVESTEETLASGTWVYEEDTEEDVVDGEESPAAGGVTFERTTTYTTDTITERRRVAVLFDVSDNEGFAESGWYGLAQFGSAHIRCDLRGWHRAGFTDEIDTIDHKATAFGLTRNTALPTTPAGFDTLRDAAANNTTFTSVVDPDDVEAETQYLSVRTWLPTVDTNTLLLMFDHETDNTGVQIDAVKFAMANHHPGTSNSGVDLTQDWRDWWDRDGLADFTLQNAIDGPDFDLDLRSLVYVLFNDTLAAGDIADIDIIDDTDAVLLTISLLVIGDQIFCRIDDGTDTWDFSIGHAAIGSNPGSQFPQINVRVRKHIIEVIAGSDITYVDGTETSIYESAPIEHSIDFSDVRLHVTAASGYKLGKLHVTPLIDPIEGTNTQCPDERTCELTADFGHPRFQVDDIVFPNLTEAAPDTTEIDHSVCRQDYTATGDIALFELPFDEQATSIATSEVLLTDQQAGYSELPVESSWTGEKDTYYHRITQSTASHATSSPTLSLGFIMRENWIQLLDAPSPSDVIVRVEITLEFPAGLDSYPDQASFSETKNIQGGFIEDPGSLLSGNQNTVSTPTPTYSFPFGPGIPKANFNNLYETSVTGGTYPTLGTYASPDPGFYKDNDSFRGLRLGVQTTNYRNERKTLVIRYEKTVSRWTAGSEPTIAFDDGDIIDFATPLATYWAVTTGSATASAVLDTSGANDHYDYTHVHTVTQIELDPNDITFNVKPI